MARYEIGQKLITVNFEIEGRDRGFYVTPYLYTTSPVVKVHLIELTVTEHHKVLNDYDKPDAEPTYDGFILKDKDGNIWHNQYPRASYGQTTDTGDRMFHMELRTELRYLDLAKKGKIFETYLLEDYLGNLNRGIQHFKAEEVEDFEKRLTDLDEIIRKQLAEEFNKTYVVEPLRETSSWLVARLVDLPQVVSEVRTENVSSPAVSEDGIVTSQEDADNLQFRVYEPIQESELDESFFNEWNDAYRAFQGAFDTPVARRKLDDEYSEDARIRLRRLNEKMKFMRVKYLNKIM